MLCHQVHGVDDGGETEGGHQGEVDTPGGHKVNKVDTPDDHFHDQGMWDTSNDHHYHGHDHYKLNSLNSIASKHDQSNVQGTK